MPPMRPRAMVWTRTSSTNLAVLIDGGKETAVTTSSVSGRHATRVSSTGCWTVRRKAVSFRSNPNRPPRLTDLVDANVLCEPTRPEPNAARQSVPIKDSLIAATVLAHGLTVVTRYARDFFARGRSRREQEGPSTPMKQLALFSRSTAP
jgi:hypothetical protein